MHNSGSALQATFGGSAIHGNIRNWEQSGEVSIYDSTAGADVAESHVTGVLKMSGSFDILADSGAAGSAIERNLYAKAVGTLLWGDLGTATGASNPKYGLYVTLTNVSKKTPYDDVIVYSVEWTGNGDWVFNYNSMGSVW